MSTGGRPAGAWVSRRRRSTLLSVISSERGERGEILCGLFLLVGPGDEGDFGAAVPSEGKEGPSESPIHIKPVTSVLMSSSDAAATARRKPECRYTGNLPLTAMAVAAENQVDGVLVVEHVEDVGRVGEEQREAVIVRGRNATKVGTVERWIIHAHNGELAGAGRNENALIDQQGDFVTVGEAGVLGNRHAAVMVVVAECDKDGSNLAEPRQEQEQRRHAFGNIQQIAGNEYPVGTQVPNRINDPVVPRLMPVDVKVAKMHCPAAGQWSMHRAQAGDFMPVEPDFPMREHAKKSIEGLAEGMADVGADPIRPRGDASDHFMTRSSSARSCAVTR